MVAKVSIHRGGWLGWVAYWVWWIGRRPGLIFLLITLGAAVGFLGLIGFSLR